MSQMFSKLRSGLRKLRIRKRCRSTFVRFKDAIRNSKDGRGNSQKLPTQVQQPSEAIAIPRNGSNIASEPRVAAPNNPSGFDIIEPDPASNAHSLGQYLAPPPMGDQERVHIQPGNRSEESLFAQDVDMQVADGDGLKIPWRAKLDTGSDVNLMALNVQKALGYPIMPYDRDLEPFNSELLTPLGVVRGVAFNFSRLPKTYEEEFLVFNTNKFDVLIGGPFIREHHLLMKNDEVLPRSVG